MNCSTCINGKLLPEKTVVYCKFKGRKPVTFICNNYQKSKED